MNPLHEQFIVESRELIQQATQDVIAIEREGLSSERRDRIFRAFHTLKGSAGVVEWPALGLVMHAAEDYFTAIHNRPITGEVIDRILDCLDHVTRWIDAFEAEGALPEQAGQDARRMAEGLRASVAAGGEGSAPNSEQSRLPDWVRELVGSSAGEIAARRRRGAICAILYEPRGECFFDGDDPLGLMRKVPELMALRVLPREPWPAPDDFDAYHCNLRIEALSAADIADLSALFRLLPDQVQIITVPDSALEPAVVDEKDIVPVQSLVDAVLDEQRRVLQAGLNSEDLIGRIRSVGRVAANALRYAGRATEADRVDAATAQALAASDQALLSRVLDQISSSSAPQHEAPQDALPAPGTATSERQAGRTIRVAEEKIEALVNLASELVLFKNSFQHLVSRAQAERELGAFVASAGQQKDALERLAGEIHSAILQLRMVPAAQAFQALPRLARDLARKIGKNVQLIIEGEAVESDKTVIDRMYEPLLHLIRNAIDHGIEPPEQRRLSGKSETAILTVRATRSADRFIVEVDDDGRGIDPQAVKRKARERGLLTDDDVAAFSDEDAVNLIFSPGFSMAAEVTDISGRGVGMDVVRSTVEDIGGRVSVVSRIGEGTTVRLDLPMTIAMSRVMVVEAEGQAFGIPMEHVTETLRLPDDEISHIKGNRAFVLRDRVVPICPLAELMNLPASSQNPQAMRLMVLAEFRGHVTAIEVDAIRDRFDAVLKPMQGVLAGAREYLGTTLRADGTVLLVLNLREILP